MLRVIAASFLLSLILLLAAGAACPAQEALNRPFRDKWAVVIGVSKFVKPELDLKYADRDAQNFYEYLLKEGKFASDHVRLLTNEKAGRRAILATLGAGWLSRQAGPEDLAVIYISSHGSPAELDVEGVNYLLASDSDPDDLYSSGIDMQALARMIKAKVHAGRVVIFLDTCYSGAGSPSAKGLVRKANADAGKISASSGQIVIASSLPSQVSWESARYPGSVFTGCLLEALRAGGGETDLDRAFALLQEKVETTVRQERGELQTPVLKSPFTRNNICLAAAPLSPRKALSEDFETTATSLNARQGMPAVTAASGERIALLPFEEGDEMGLDMPDYEGLPRLLEELVRLRLSSGLSDRLLSPYDVGAALSKTNLNAVWTPESRLALANACRAGYLVKVRIKKAHFDENGKLDFSVSVCVASGKTGDYIWSGGHKAAELSCPGTAAERLNYLKKNVLPAFAVYISRAVTAAVTPK
jgi:hypothetical protein